MDTRGGAAVNIEKYNEKFEDMAGMKGGDNLRRNNKEKNKTNYSITFILLWVIVVQLSYQMKLVK